MLAAQQLGLETDLLSDSILTALWRHDRDIADVEVFRSLAIECRMDPEPILELALSPAIQQAFRQCTVQAIEAGVPGSATYCLDGQLFDGQDRLTFVEHQLKEGFPQSPRTGAGV